MGRAAETVYGEATVSRQDGATEEKRQEVCRYIKETAGQYPNHRGMKKKLMDLMPETPFEGESMAVTREPNKQYYIIVPRKPNGLFAFGFSWHKI